MVENLQSVLLHAVAPIDILKIQKEAFVHQADSRNGLLAHKHCSTQHPIDFDRTIMIKIKHEMISNRL